MNLWPVSLQGKVNVDGFSYSFGETAIETEMDIGPKKKRRLYTKPIDEITCTIDVTSVEYSTFYTFYDVTLNGGVDTFWFDNPITHTSEEYRFKSPPPKVTPLGGDNFRINMTWIRMPV